MAVTPSKRYKGAPLSVTFTPTFPTSGAAAVLDGIKSGRYDRGISQKMEAADGDGFNTVQFSDFQTPTQSFETINPYAAAAIGPSSRGTLAYTIADADNGVQVGGGGRGVSMANAFLMGENIDHVYREYGKNSISFGCISADGTTHPVTFTAT